METAGHILDLKQKFRERAKEEFLPLIVRSDMVKLIENGDLNRNWFISHVKNFYTNCAEYLEL